MHYLFYIIISINNHAGVSSKPVCVGGCVQFPDCAGHCQSLGYKTGLCVIDVCCCSKK